MYDFDSVNEEGTFMCDECDFTDTFIGTYDGCLKGARDDGWHVGDTSIICPTCVEFMEDEEL